MTEDIKLEVIKRTQDALGKYIKKPPLTEKLLRKPPFRFLHDIITSVMKETGAFQGLFTTVEIKAENIKDKEAKIAFLQKIIVAVEGVNGVKLSVRPNKIVAGHEPTKTNEFLQALGKAIEKKHENGGSGSQDNPNKSKHKNSSLKKAKDETQSKKRNATTDSKKTKSEKSKPIENGIEEVSKKPAKSLNIEQVKNDVVEGDGEEVNDGVVQNGEQMVVNGDVGTRGEGDASVEQEVHVRPQSAKPHHRKPSALSGHPLDRNITSASINNHETSPPHELEQTQRDNRSESVLGERVQGRPDGASVSRVSNNRPDSILGDRVKTTPSPPQVNGNRDVTNENGTAASARPRTSARPASARPAAPRIRDRGEVIIQEDVIRPVTGKVNVIVENGTTTDDPDDDNIVSLEGNIDLNLDDELPLTTQSGARGSSAGEHGHLVQQILETQKELEDTSHLLKTKSSGQVEIEWETGRSRENTQRDVDKLRNCIQTLTRSVNPLGKLLDFVQEDVDTMENELEKWKQMNVTLSVQLAQEQSLTEQSIEPLKVHLRELQGNIDQEREVISFMKANIMRNDEKIQQLLMG